MKSNRSRTTVILSLILGLAMGAGLGMSVISRFRAGDDLLTMFVRLALMMVLITLASNLQIILHELGHMIGGLATGYTFSSFRFRSLMLVRQDGRLTLKRMQIAGTGGQCLMMPPRWQEGGVPYRMYLAGGWTANAVTAVLSLILAFLLRGSMYPFVFFAAMGLFGLYYAVTNGLPLSFGVDNDGMNYRSVQRDPRLLRDLWLQLEVNGLLSQGYRMRDLPEEWFTVPPADQMDASLATTIAVFGVNRAMDAMDLERAEELTTVLLDRATLLPIHKNMVKAEAIYIDLIRFGRRTFVDQLFDDEFKAFLHGQSGNPSIIRIMHAYALLYLQDTELALSHERRFEAAAAVYPYPSELAGERDLMQLTRDTYAQRFVIPQAEQQEETAPKEPAPPEETPKPDVSKNSI